MSAITFDTHEFITELKQAGLTEPQAEAIARLHKQSINTTIDYVKHEHNLDEVVTNKQLDSRIKETELKIEQVKSDLQRDLKESELRLELKIAESKADLIRWVVAVGLLQVTIITALIIKLSGNL